MPGLDPALRSALARIVGDDHVIDDPGRLLVYESDGLTRYRSTPLGVVLPASTQETAEVVRLLANARVPMVARGAGTGLSGGALADSDAVVIGTARMNRILELDGPGRRARVEAGVVNADLAARTAPLGLFYAPDPSSQTACTLGGNVAENSGGPHCLKYGVTTRYVTGLTAVTAEGAVLHLGGAEREDPIDVTGLVVGSEGCFALVTEIEVRLLPRPAAVRTLLGVFDSPSTAGSAVSAIVARGLLPAALEIIDRNTIEAVESSAFAAGYPTGAGAVLVIEFDGPEVGIDAEASTAASICEEFGAIEVRRAETEVEREALWKGRKKAFGAMGRIAPDLMVQDATVPRSVLPQVLDRISEISERYRLRVANVFHAGDGNLHPNLLFDRRDPEETERVEQASKEIMHACVELGGTITGEHGVGVDKRHYMHLVHGPDELAAMARVREAFDPAGLLNPGKVLPVDEKPTARFGVPASESVADLVEYRPEDLTITVGGGMPWARLVELTREQGQCVPLCTPEDMSSSVARIVETAPANLWSTVYGEVRDLVLGARVHAGSDGVSLRLGGKVVKNVAGFDLLRPVVGSRGRMGRVHEVTFRLYPDPPERRRWRVEADLGAVDRILRASLHLPIVPAALLLFHDGAATTLEIEAHGTSERMDALGGALATRLGSMGSLDRVEAGAPSIWHPAQETPRAWPLRSSGPVMRGDLRVALRVLLSDECGEPVRSVHDLTTGRDFWSTVPDAFDADRWRGVAGRWASAGGELKAADPHVGSGLHSILEDVRYADPRRSGTRELANRVVSAFNRSGGPRP